MDRVEVPRADLTLLLYLTCVMALLVLFALAIYGLMQPTVIPNAGLAGYKAPGPAALFLHKPDLSSETMERAAIASANADNKDQGIEPLRAFASAEPAHANPADPNTSTATSHDSKHAKKAKPKRAPKQDNFADPGRSPWGSPWQTREYGQRWNGRSGPYGSRPLWAFGNGF
jgi:hypothetical protein